jgi:hypothetical protein
MERHFHEKRKICSTSVSPSYGSRNYGEGEREGNANRGVVRLRARKAAVGSGAESCHGSLPQRHFVATRSLNDLQ